MLGITYLGKPSAIHIFAVMSKLSSANHQQSIRSCDQIMADEN